VQPSKILRNALLIGGIGFLSGMFFKAGQSISDYITAQKHEKKKEELMKSAEHFLEVVGKQIEEQEFENAEIMLATSKKAAASADREFRLMIDAKKDLMNDTGLTFLFGFVAVGLLAGSSPNRKKEPASPKL